MATTKFYLDMRGKAKDGKGSIVILLYHNFSTTSFSTGIRLFPNEWSNQQVVRNMNSGAINSELQKQKSKIDREIGLLSFEEGFASMTAPEIKSRIVTKKKRKDSGHLVAELFEEYMSNGGLKEGTKNIYRATLKKVVAFGGSQMKIENLDLRWLRSFDQYLAKTQGVNGRSIFLRSLRAICNYACQINIDCPYPFKNFQIKSEPTKKRNISKELLKEFYLFPVKDNRLVMYRDYFFLMFYLIGINTKDLLLAKKSQIVNGRFEYIREKTGKRYSIRLEPEALELISKYSGKDEYLLDAMDHCQHYRSFAHQINDALKLIGTPIEESIPESDDLFAELTVVKRIEPVIPGITTYYARHTWATFAYEIGIQMDIISQALGHSMGNRTTLIYVQPDQSKVDEANRKVLDYFMKDE